MEKFLQSFWKQEREKELLSTIDFNATAMKDQDVNKPDYPVLFNTTTLKKSKPEDDSEEERPFARTRALKREASSSFHSSSSSSSPFAVERDVESDSELQLDQEVITQYPNSGPLTDDLHTFSDSILDGASRENTRTNIKNTRKLLSRDAPSQMQIASDTLPDREPVENLSDHLPFEQLNPTRNSWIAKSEQILASAAAELVLCSARGEYGRAEKLAGCLKKLSVSAKRNETSASESSFLSFQQTLILELRDLINSDPGIFSRSLSSSSSAPENWETEQTTISASEISTRPNYQLNQFVFGGSFAELSRLNQLLDYLMDTKMEIERRRTSSPLLSQQICLEFLGLCKARVEFELFQPPHFQQPAFVIECAKIIAFIWEYGKQETQIAILETGTLDLFLSFLPFPHTNSLLRYSVALLFSTVSQKSESFNWFSRGFVLRALIGSLHSYLEMLSQPLRTLPTVVNRREDRWAAKYILRTLANIFLSVSVVNTLVQSIPFTKPHESLLLILQQLIRSHSSHFDDILFLSLL